MGVVKALFANIQDAIKTKNFKLNPNMKRIIVLILMFVGLCVMVAFLLSESDDSVLKKQDQLSAGYESIQEQKEESGEYIPPKIDNIENTNTQETPPAVINPFVTQDKTNNANEGLSIPDLSAQNLSQQEQEEIIKQIAKQQKPEDMIAFLKEAQSKFNFLKSQKKFKYELKNYEVGDIFLWWEIEEITPVYIRFKDRDYSYNLRFLEE